MKKKMKGISKNSDLLRANPDFKGLSEGRRDKILIIRGLLKIVFGHELALCNKGQRVA